MSCGFVTSLEDVKKTPTKCVASTEYNAVTQNTLTETFSDFQKFYKF